MPDTPDFENLYDVFKDFPEKKAVVQQWEKAYRTAALKQNLYEHDAMKQLVELLRGFILDNEEKLKVQVRDGFNRDELFFAARDRMLAENGCWTLLIGFFTQAKSEATQIESNVVETEGLNAGLVGAAKAKKKKK